MAMYIDIVPNRKSPPAILLRESYRDNGKVKKRTLANLTQWPPERINHIRKLLKGEFDCGIPLEKTPISGPIFAVLFVLKAIADRLQITSVIGKQKLAKVALLLIFARISAKGSRLHALKWAQDHAIAETIGIKELKLKDLYQAPDWLSDNQERIEKRLFAKRHPDEKIPDLFLYDVTSSYLEGVENELADWGYNRDKKSGKKQIVIGLLTDNQGEPVAVRVFEGRTGDTATVPEQIRTLSHEFGVKRVTFVGDKGMVRGPQIKQLQSSGFNYITSVTKKEIAKLLKEGNLRYELFSDKIAEVEEVQEEVYEKKNRNNEIIQEKIKRIVRYVIRRNPIRMEEMRKNRDACLRKVIELASDQTQYLQKGARRKPEVALRKVNEKISRYKLSSAVTAELSGNEGRVLKVKTDRSGYERVGKSDGCYVIKTDLSKKIISARDVHDRYKDLSKVERAFKLMKTEFLEIRPIFVRLESRTRGHVFGCMLAYMILREMRRGLGRVFRIDDDGRLLVDERNVLEALSRLTLLYYETDTGEMIPDIAEPDERQKKILNALGVSIPSFGLARDRVKAIAKKSDKSNCHKPR